MPFLDEQVKIINDALRAQGIGESRYPGCQIHDTVAEQVVENDEGDADKHYPVVYNPQGKPNHVGLDDKYPLIIYHRQRSGTFTRVASNFGSDNSIMREESAMSMLVYGSRSRLKLSPQQLSSLITLAMPSEVSATLLSGIQIDTMSVVLNNTNMESLSAFREEYAKVDYAIPPGNFLFRISYTITTQYRKGCFNICDCVAQ